MDCYDAGLAEFRRAQQLRKQVAPTEESKALLAALGNFTHVVAGDPRRMQSHCASAFLLERLKRHREALLERSHCKADSLEAGPEDDPAQMLKMVPFVEPDDTFGILDVVLAEGARRIAVRIAGEPWWYFYELGTDYALSVPLTLQQGQYEMLVEWATAQPTHSAISVLGGQTVKAALVRPEDGASKVPWRFGLGVRASAVLDEDFEESLAAAGGAYVLVRLREQWSLQAGPVVSRRTVGGQLGALFRLIGPLQLDGGGTLITTLPNEEPNTFIGGYLGPRLDIAVSWAYAALTGQYFFVANDYDPFFLLLSFGMEGGIL